MASNTICKILDIYILTLLLINIWIAKRRCFFSWTKAMKNKVIICLLLFTLQQIYSQKTNFDFSLINPSITSSNLRAAWFFDESSGYIAGKAGSVLFTRDSGKTWHEYETPKRIWIVSLFFHDVQYGWGAGGFNGQLYLISTSDSGHTWKEHRIPGLENTEIYKIKFLTVITGGLPEGRQKTGSSIIQMMAVLHG